MIRIYSDTVCNHCDSTIHGQFKFKFILNDDNMDGGADVPSVTHINGQMNYDRLQLSL